MSLIKGIHHVSMKCSSTEEYEKTIDFYKNILEIRLQGNGQWESCLILETELLRFLMMEMERWIKVSYVILRLQQMMLMRCGGCKSSRI